MRFYTSIRLADVANVPAAVALAREYDSLDCVSIAANGNTVRFELDFELGDEQALYPLGMMHFVVGVISKTFDSSNIDADVLND